MGIIANFKTLPALRLSKERLAITVFSNLPVTTANLRYVCEISFPDESVTMPNIKTVTIYADPIYADPTSAYLTLHSTVRFELAEAIDKAMRSNPALAEDLLPTAIGNVQRKYGRLTAKCDINIYEYSGDPAAVTDTLTINGTMNILGGVDYMTFSGNYSSVFFDNWTSTKRFLSWQPGGRPDNRNTYLKLRQELAFVVPATASYYADVLVTQLDGTQTTLTLLAVTPFSQYEVQTLPAGLQAMAGIIGVDFPDADTIDWYEITVYDAGDAAVTESKRFYVDQEYRPYQRDFIWLNSVGGLDSCSLNGKSTFNPEITSDELNKYPEWGYNGPYQGFVNAMRKSVNRKEQVTIHVSTGYKPKDVIDGLREMLLSELLAEVLPDKTSVNAMIPIAIVPGTFKTHEDGADNWMLEFDYKYLFDNSFYTPWSVIT